MKEFKNELMITLAPSSWCYYPTYFDFGNDYFVD